MRYRIFQLMSLFLILGLACSLTRLTPAEMEETIPSDPTPGNLDITTQEPDTQSAEKPDLESLSRDSSAEIDLPPMATPYAESPAAGICGEFEGQWVTVTIYPDIPDPRCSFVRPEQMLEVVNQRDETLTVSIGQFEVEISPGESHQFELAFGEYLMPGVHHLSVQPCCGAELVLGD